METKIVHYVHSRRDKNNIRSGVLRGVVVAQIRPENPNEVGIGWSLARRKDGKQLDHFNKQLGLDIAINRAAIPSREKLVVPRSMEDEVKLVLDRATHYFKDKKVIAPVFYVSETKAEDIRFTQFVESLASV